MSIPRKHHFVSECQIKNFYNDDLNRIFLYDKECDNHFSRMAPKSIFREKDCNSKIENGVIDHGTLEKELNLNFENDFLKHFNIIKSIINSNHANLEEIEDSVVYIAKYGIAGYLRHPIDKKNTDNTIFKPFFEELMPIAAPDLKCELKLLKEELGKVNYSNLTSYKDFVESVFDKMGDIRFDILQITSDDYFLIGDKSSFVQRRKINEYFNPNIEEIAIIDIPLSSKVLLKIESKKLSNKPSRFIQLNNNDSKFIFDVNYAILKLSFKQVGCENEEYLNDFIEKLRKDELL
ncbi:DUF4238 domain-containing protein [Pseudofulvibacter geojedonensis]|uniref:DUF4238 domain-containing protein n=1 Tax=Pseudofulvibacter geojedonensis TaxID=1123758 RepID=A0ABW3I5I4_9FLAO